MRFHMRKGLVTPVLQAWAAMLLLAYGAAFGQTLTMASTTSTEQSGLFAHLLPAFKAASGLDVKVVAVGTGQANPCQPQTAPSVTSAALLSK